MNNEKQFSLLHKLTDLFQNREKTLSELLGEMTLLLPSAWQYPKITAARVNYDGEEFKTPNFAITPWRQKAEFNLNNKVGIIDIFYLEDRSQEPEGPFTTQEKWLLDFIANILVIYLDYRETSEALLKTEQEFNLMINNIPAIAFKGYLDGSIDLFDDKIEKITGHSRADFTTRTLKWIDMVFPEDRDKLKAIFLKALKSGKTYIREYRIKGKHEKPIWIQERSHILYDRNGKFSHISGVFCDITERKRVEEELKKYRDHLEELVEKRTYELITANANLQQEIADRQKAQEALKEANERLTRWAQELERSNHEINLLRQMSDLLQICQTLKEADAVVAQFISQLYPQDSGAFYVFGSSGDLVEAAFTWGEAPPQEKVFAPDDCWALRRGQAFFQESATRLRCRHAGEESRAYFCLPIMVRGEVLGLLHVLARPGEKAQWEGKQRLALNIGELLGLALTNLKLRETLHNLSVRDPLTGLFNRRYMEVSLQRELARAQRHGTPVGVIMLDLDHFKQYNDTFGHDAGDSLLREMAAAMQTHIRNSDIACRYGGEEFTLILPEASLEIAQQRAEQLREAMHQLRVLQGSQYLDGPVTLSLGVASFPEHGVDEATLLQAADAALYQAKKSGRNCVRVAAAE